MRRNVYSLEYQADGTWRDRDEVGLEGGQKFQTIDQVAFALTDGKKDYPKGVKIGTVLVIKLRKEARLHPNLKPSTR
jgi:hypothetical protein